MFGTLSLEMMTFCAEFRYDQVMAEERGVHEISTPPKQSQGLAKQWRMIFT
jgi:hypothetical protein